MTALVIDDNKIARTTLKQLASVIEDINVVEEFSNALDAYNFLLKNSVDVLLLDIEMPGMSGLELTKNLSNPKPVIIFTTSKKEYAVEAFELNVADYLIKPVTPERFFQAINRARTILQSKNEDIQATEDEFVFIRDTHVIRRISFDEILYVEAMGDYVKIHTTQKFYVIHNRLMQVEKRLPANKFLRVHRSFIIAVSKIDTIEEGSLIIKGKVVPVADAYRASLNKRLNVL